MILVPSTKMENQTRNLTRLRCYTPRSWSTVHDSWFGALPMFAIVGEPPSSKAMRKYGGTPTKFAPFGSGLTCSDTCSHSENDVGACYVFSFRNGIQFEGSRRKLTVSMKSQMNFRLVSCADARETTYARKHRSTSCNMSCRPSRRRILGAKRQVETERLREGVKAREDKGKQRSDRHR